MSITRTRRHSSSLLLLPSISSKIKPVKKPENIKQYHVSSQSNNNRFGSDYNDIKNKKIAVGKEQNSLTESSRIKTTIPQSPRILIVDDEVDIARLFKFSLERNGFVVDEFSDPVIALSNYKAGIYDLLLLDIRMPIMNGLELYREIKNKDEKVKVCFITAYEQYQMEFTKLFPNSEVDCFIKKPIELRTLAKIVKSKLAST